MAIPEETSKARLALWAADEPDPARLPQGTGKLMRHVKLKPGTAANATGLRRPIEAAYSDIKARVEHG